MAGRSFVRFGGRTSARQRPDRSSLTDRSSCNAAMKKPPSAPISMLAGTIPTPRTASPFQPKDAKKPITPPKPTAPDPQSSSGLGTANNEQLNTEQVLLVLSALKRGDFSVRLPVTWTGTAGRIADAFNDVAELLASTTQDLSRVCRAVGKEGKISERLSTGNVSGAWAERVNSVNTLISCLVHPISETARVIGAVGRGDLPQTMALEIESRPLEGEFLRTAKTVNRMVDQLGAFASEVTRVAREVGTEGKLGGQAKVKGVAGTWKDLTDNVNLMASNLTSQVRNIAAVTTAVANGDLSKKITVNVKGEILELKNTINTMVDQL